MSETIAIGHPGWDSDWKHKVPIWASIESETSDEIEFWVINGCWNGTFYPKRNELILKEYSDQPPIQAILVWRGEVPKEFSRDYNDAIDWISLQIVVDREAGSC
jgi:hypothetical protein